MGASSASIGITSWLSLLQSQNPSPITNSGTIAALGTNASVQIVDVTVADSTTKALILASGNGARVTLGDVTISGGTLKTSGGGQITALNGNTLSGVTLAASSLIDVTNGTLTLKGRNGRRWCNHRNAERRYGHYERHRHQWRRRLDRRRHRRHRWRQRRER
jgi:hypothetical protein